VSDASDESQDLRATAEDLIEDAERVQEIEHEKLELPADDPRMVDLARESERIVRSMVPKAASETELAEGASTERSPEQ
jgi:hypothetical protein